MPRPTTTPAAAHRRDRRDAAAEQRVRARAVRDRDAPVGRAARSRRPTPRRSGRRGGRARAPARAWRRRACRSAGRAPGSPASDAGPVLEPLVLARALGEVRADGDAERQAPAVRLERAGVGRVRRDADPSRAPSPRRARASPRTAAVRRPDRRRTPRGRRSRAARARRPRSPRRRRSCSRRSS